jgi:hypothetical protein
MNSLFRSQSHSDSRSASSSYASFNECNFELENTSRKGNPQTAERMLLKEAKSTSSPAEETNVDFKEDPRETPPRVEGPPTTRRPVKAKDVLKLACVVSSLPLRAALGAVAAPLGFTYAVVSGSVRAVATSVQDEPDENTWDRSDQIAEKVRKYDQRIVLADFANDRNGAVASGVRALASVRSIDTVWDQKIWKEPHQPSSLLSGLTMKSRIDIGAHGNSTLCAGLTPKELAEKLANVGLKQVGVIKLNSCFAGRGSYIEQLGHELDKCNIQFGWISGSRDFCGDLRVSAKFGESSYTYSPFALPWHRFSGFFVPEGLIFKALKGNANVDFKGTIYNANKSMWRIASDHSPFH